MTANRHGPSTPPDPLAGFPTFQGMELGTLRRFVLGVSPQVERGQVTAWAQEHRERRQYLEALCQLQGRVPDPGVEDRSAAWARLASRLERPTGRSEAPYAAPWEAPAVPVRVRRRRNARILMGAFAPRPGAWSLPLAAGVLLVTAIVGLRMLEPAIDPPPVQPATTTRRVATTRGQRAEIRLDDGTRVTLGVESRLEFQSDFGSRARDVYLDGTADFAVVHDTTKPFTVHTANAVTTDVGTRFVVRAYPTDGRTEVVVSEGSVALKAPSGRGTHEVVLTKNQLGVLVAGTPKVTVRHVDASTYSAWTHGQLVFRDAPLSAVVRELGRWYETPVRLGDPALNAMPFSASFSVESLHDAVTTLTTVLPLRAVRRGSAVVLYRKAAVGGRTGE
jgi:transmembrane sensor